MYFNVPKELVIYKADTISKLPVYYCLLVLVYYCYWLTGQEDHELFGHKQAASVLLE